MLNVNSILHVPQFVNTYLHIFFVKACPKLDLPAFSWYSIFGCGAKKDCRQAKRYDILKRSVR